MKRGGRNRRIDLEDAANVTEANLHELVEIDQALLALADLGDASGAAEMARLARSDPDPTVRAAAVLALGRHASTGSDVLSSISTADDSPEVRRLARHALDGQSVRHR